MIMYYYIFKVNDSIGQEYFILNNQYIGYLNLSTGDIITNILEAKGKVKQQYQLYAQSIKTNINSLHEENCKGIRYTKEEVDNVIKNYSSIFTLSDDLTWYKEYYPNKNCSEFHLKEIDGDKIIK